MKANCPKCKKPFNLKEHVCPNCGYTLTNTQYRFRRFAWRFFCCTMVLSAIVILIVISAPKPEKAAQDVQNEPAAAMSQENKAVQSEPTEELPKDNPFTRKVKNQAGREWVMTEVYPGVPWDSKYFFKKLGISESFDPEDLNPRIVKMFYFPDIDMTIMVNINKNEVMAWRDRRATR